MRDGCVREAADLLITAFAVTHRPAASLAQLQARCVVCIASVETCKSFTQTFDQSVFAWYVAGAADM
jgi:hypothetical protein